MKLAMYICIDIYIYYRLYDLTTDLWPLAFQAPGDPGDGSSSERETMSSIMRLALSTWGLGYIMTITLW